jgi:hypothetical protein
MLLFCIIMIGSISYIRKGSNFGTNREKVIKCARAMLCCWKTNGLRGLPGVFRRIYFISDKVEQFRDYLGEDNMCACAMSCHCKINNLRGLPGVFGY